MEELAELVPKLSSPSLISAGKVAGDAVDFSGSGKLWLGEEDDRSTLQ